MAERFRSLIASVVADIDRDYEQARDHARQNDPQRAGHEGESTWKRLLDAWGSNWPVVTRKYVVGPGGESNEVDLLILKPNYPKHLLDQPAVLVSGVAAAFSSKLTLRRPHLKEAILQKRKLLDVAGRPSDTPEEALAGAFPFGLLAHGSALGSHPDVADHMQELYERVAHDDSDPLVRTPSEELDALLVANEAFVSTRRMSLAPVPRAPHVPWQPTSSFVRHPPNGLPGAPLAQFLTWLHGRCAGPSNSSIHSLEADFGAQSASGYITSWPIDIYPEFMRESNFQRLRDDHGNPLMV